MQKNITNRNREHMQCQQFDETVEHTVSACSMLAKEQYPKRHDSVCVVSHAMTRVTEDSAHWYVQVTISRKGQDGNVTILCNELLQTG
jgi:hypothetical protein